MAETKPSEIIAARFQISVESAKYFLGRVQKSFKVEKPPHQLIIEFMSARSFDSLPKAHEVASMMQDNGVWDHPLNPAPAEPADEPDLYDE